MSMSGMAALNKIKDKRYEYFFYRCNGKKEELTWQHGKCPSRFILAEWLEDLVWREVASWIVDGITLESALTQALSTFLTDQDQWKRALTTLNEQLDTLETQRQRVIALFRKGSISEKDLETQLADVMKERHVLQETIAAYEQKLVTSADPRQMLEQMRSHLSQFGEALRNGTLPPQEKRKIIESLVAEVRVRRAAYRGRALTPVAIQQTIPFREDIPKEPEQAIRETLWSRDPQPQPEEPPKESVQIVYRFRSLQGSVIFCDLLTLLTSRTLVQWEAIHSRALRPFVDGASAQEGRPETIVSGYPDSVFFTSPNSDFAPPLSAFGIRYQ
jgi:hypothetical protein